MRARAKSFFAVSTSTSTVSPGNPPSTKTTRPSASRAKASPPATSRSGVNCIRPAYARPPDPPRRPAPSPAPPRISRAHHITLSGTSAPNSGESMPHHRNSERTSRAERATTAPNFGVHVDRVGEVGRAARDWVRERRERVVLGSPSARCVVPASQRGPGDHMLGPYPSRAEAMNWKAKVEQRNEGWDDADEQWDQGDTRPSK